MEKSKKIYSVMQFCISILITIFSVLILLFDLWYVKGVDGDNGFSFLGFNSHLSTIIEEHSNIITDAKTFCSLVGIVLWIQLALTMAYLVALLILAVKKINKKSNNYEDVVYSFNAFIVVFALVYLFLGIASRGIIVNYLTIIDPSMQSSIEALTLTSSYIPLIISVILFVVYLIITYFKNNSTKQIANGIVSTTELKQVENENVADKPATLSNEQKIQTLSQYYELVQKGILSQEEFQDLKQKIMQ